eukprot:Polyplicarium_translucidae@DN433_c0_g1_i1.p1
MKAFLGKAQTIISQVIRDSDEEGEAAEVLPLEALPDRFRLNAGDVEPLASEVESRRSSLGSRGKQRTASIYDDEFHPFTRTREFLEAAAVRTDTMPPTHLGQAPGAEPLDAHMDATMAMQPLAAQAEAAPPLQLLAARDETAPLLQPPVAPVETAPSVPTPADTREDGDAELFAFMQQENFKLEKMLAEERARHERQTEEFRFAMESLGKRYEALADTHQRLQESKRAASRLEEEQSERIQTEREKNDLSVQLEMWKKSSHDLSTQLRTSLNENADLRLSVQHHEGSMSELEDLRTKLVAHDILLAEAKQDKEALSRAVADKAELEVDVGALQETSRSLRALLDESSATNDALRAASNEEVGRLMAELRRARADAEKLKQESDLHVALKSQFEEQRVELEELRKQNETLGKYNEELNEGMKRVLAKLHSQAIQLEDFVDRRAVSARLKAALDTLRQEVAPPTPARVHACLLRALVSEVGLPQSECRLLGVVDDEPDAPNGPEVSSLASQFREFLDRETVH